jgi:hypothetical protein
MMVPHGLKTFFYFLTYMLVTCYLLIRICTAILLYAYSWLQHVTGQKQRLRFLHAQCHAVTSAMLAVACAQGVLSHCCLATGLEVDCWVMAGSLAVLAAFLTVWKAGCCHYGCGAIAAVVNSAVV